MTGAHSRHAPDARSARPATTSSVTAALSGGPAGAVSAGTSFSMSKMMGMTVTAISMMTVPATVGVITRRTQDSRADSTNWKSADTKTSVASMPGPPSASAVTDTAMNAPEVPISNG